MSGWGEDLEIGDATPADLAQAIQNRPTGFGEYLGAQLGLGFEDTSTGLTISTARAGPPTAFSAEGQPNPAYQEQLNYPQTPEWLGPEQAQSRGITQDEFNAIKGDRKIPFNPFMSRDTAQALIDQHDEQAWREWLIEQRHAGPIGGTLGFLAGFVGGAPDPINFIPLAGEEWMLARGAKQLSRMAMIGRHAAAGAGEAALGTAVLEPFIMAHHAAIGDDMSFTEAAYDIVLGGLLGGVVGGGAGWWHSRGIVPTGHPGLMPPVEDVARAGELVNLAVPDVIADRPVTVAGPLDRFRNNLLGSTAMPTPWQPEARRGFDEPIPGSEITTAPPRQPPTATAYLRSLGGIQPTSEMDLDYRSLQKSRPGLVSRRGLKVDEAVGHLVEAGYLPAREGVNDASRADELAALLEHDISGGETRPIGAEDRASHEAWWEQHTLDKDLVKAAEPHGGISANELAIARRLVEEHDLEHEDAIVEALTHAALRDDEGRLLEAAGVGEDAFDIPFDDLSGRAAPGAGERAGQPGRGEPGVAGGGSAAGATPGAAGRGAGGADALARAGASGDVAAARDLTGASTGTDALAHAAEDHRGGPAEAVDIREQIRRFVAGEVEASRAPRPLSDASPGTPRPDPVAEIKAALAEPEPKPEEVLEDYPEAADFEAALADGRVAPEERAAVERAQAEIERLAKIEQAHDQAAVCVLGGLG